jgi:glycerol transport system substrate-binding protein
MQLACELTDMMAGDWAATTNPGLDLDDFIGRQFTTGPDGKLYQLPDQQFANLCWFRKDRFDREDLKAAFREKSGHELGVPVNGSACEDIADFVIADFFTNEGRRSTVCASTATWTTASAPPTSAGG